MRIFGKPDFVFPKARLALFIDGCFWHRCRKPGHSNAPRNNAEFWAAKLTRNVARDRLVTRTLKKEGWGVLRFWEHALANPKMCAFYVKKRLAKPGPVKAEERSGVPFSRRLKK
jgi:DNA mismatch endonuclease (patch repair protein)